MDELDGSASAHTTEPLDVARLTHALSFQRLGHTIQYFPALPSTSTYATELARAGAPEGTLVTTDDQTAGRGRIGRVWKSLPGQQLSLSLILKPRFPVHFLVMASAVAVRDAIATVTGLRASIKWPNDVLVGPRKVCGVLIEVVEGTAILGLGINVNGSMANDPDLATRATTLEQVVGHRVSREDVALAVLQRLDRHYADLQTGGHEAQAALRDAWRAHLDTLGAAVTIQQNDEQVRGTAENITPDGALLLRLSDGTLRTITWGDVSS